MANQQSGYQLPDNLFRELSHLSGRTGQIIRWLFTEIVQQAIGGTDGWEITIHGKGDSIKTAIKVYRDLK